MRVRRRHAVRVGERPVGRSIRHDERVDAHQDQAFGARDELVGVLAGADEQIGGDAAAAEDADTLAIAADPEGNAACAA